MYQFVECDYSGTGEGRTISLLITHAYPTAEQRKAGMSPEEVALEEFTQRFGEWFAQGAKVQTKDRFIKTYQHVIPAFILELLDSEDPPGNLNWSTQYYFNFS